jgi:FixJ family two-component response regulator
MPELTGSQLAQQLRKLRADIPIVLMSGYGGATLATPALAAGANEILSKPLVVRDIARCLASVLAPPRGHSLAGDGRRNKGSAFTRGK